MAEDPYTKDLGFWELDDELNQVMGDPLGRRWVINFVAMLVGLLDGTPPFRVLDAGCGQGRVTRIVAKVLGHRARLYGCDVDQGMLTKAIEAEQKLPYGIDYRLADIMTLDIYPDDHFDIIYGVGVHIHLRAPDLLKSFHAAWEKLRPGGFLVIGLMHEFLYNPGSPNRTGQADWAQYTPLGGDAFNEHYRRRSGEYFDSTVQCHGEDDLQRLLTAANFQIQSTHQVWVTQADLDLCGMSGEVGYPAFTQLIAWKPRTPAT